MDTSETVGEFKTPNLLNDNFFNIPLSDIDIGRESIPILDLSTSFGRESLGILHKGTQDPTEHHFNFSSLSNGSANILNKAFMLSTCGSTDFGSVSTAYSKFSTNFSFDLDNYDDISAINSLGTFNSIQAIGSVNILNEARLNNVQETTQHSIFRSRFQSLPAYSKISNEFDSKRLIEKLMNRVSEGCHKMNDSIQKKIEEEEMEAGYNDSVFIEARHLTAKFSEEGSNDGFLLDETDPPELLNGDLEESKCDQKCDSKDIFKKIDTFLPVSGYQKLNEKLDHRVTLNQMSHSNETDSDNKEEVNSQEIKTEVSDIEKSKQILNALSEILLKDDRSEGETEQGRNLLNSLGDMLNKRSKSFTATCTTSINEKDNSVKSTSKIIQTPLAPSNSFSSVSNNSKSKLITSLGRSQDSLGSDFSIEGRNFSGNTLKPSKKVTLPSRRGPIKATIPMENITKSLHKGTPPRLQQKLPKYSGRISTPIREAHPKPMAQSTPDNRIVGVDRNASNSKEKSNNSNSINSLSSYKDSSVSREGSFLQNSRLPRRNSVSEVKRSPMSSELKRSNSLKETSLMKTMSKIRQNISNSLDYPKKDALRDCSNTSGREVSSFSGKNSSGSRKIMNTPRKMIQSPGKENSLAVY